MIKLVAYLDSDTLKTYKLTVKNQFFKKRIFYFFKSTAKYFQVVPQMAAR